MSQRTCSGWKAFAVLLLIATPAAALDEYSAESAWRDCVLQKAADFAKGRDAASVIIDGALDACFDQQKSYAAAISPMERRGGTKDWQQEQERIGTLAGITETIKDKRREIGAAALITVLQYRASH
jgi:hypothetical protein